MIDRAWLRAYPDGLPACLSTLCQNALVLFRHTVTEDPDREALRYFDASISYQKLDQLSDGFAAWLRTKDVSAGDRVAIILQNVPHFVIAVLGAWKIGAIPVPGNPMYRETELGRILADSAPVAVVAHREGRATLEASQAAAKLTAPILFARAHDFQSCGDSRILPPDAADGSEHDFLTACTTPGEAVPLTSPESSALGLILYTSGTTGLPKGAMISHGSIAFNSQAAALWMGVTKESRVLGLAPLFHITGFILHMSLAMSAGASLALHYRFHPEGVLDVIRSYRPTMTIAAITAFNALMHAPGVDSSDFDSFDATFSGGAPIAPALRQALRARLGIELHPVYGMTETCAPTHVAPLGAEVPVDAVSGALSVGLPISSTEAMIADPDGSPLPAGEAGEIWVRGPQVMQGYWNKPEETSAALSAAGWLKTGDIGCMDSEGWFYVVDRQKDMINASGFKVWPREVEDVLHLHPDVREAAVVGAPDAYRGETVLAYISIANGTGSIDEQALRDFCRSRLAAYKVPRSIIVMDELPKTPTGKIQRNVLRGGAAQDLSSRDRQ